MPDVAGDPTTTAVVSIGSTTQGTIDSLGDHDWYAVTLAYGQSITITVAGDYDLDTYVNVCDSTGTTVLASNDDIGTGDNTDSRRSSRLQPRAPTISMSARTTISPPARTTCSSSCLPFRCGPMTRSQPS